MSKKTSLSLYFDLAPKTKKGDYSPFTSQNENEDEDPHLPSFRRKNFNSPD